MKYIERLFICLFSRPTSWKYEKSKWRRKWGSLQDYSMIRVMLNGASIKSLLFQSLVFFIQSFHSNEFGSIPKQKIPPDFSGRILLRSLPDSNRRRWFCRPLPNHSAKRPFYIRPPDNYRVPLLRLVGEVNK